MSLRHRLFAAFCIVFLIGFFSVSRWMRGELRDRYSQAVEEILVDYAHIISAYLESHKMSQESFNSLGAAFNQYKLHKINAQIFDFLKTNPALELYVTDVNGVVIFSTKRSLIGQNFSKWNDVYKALQGKYGARSTRLNTEDSSSSVYFVAAPITINSKIVGVATIFKSESSILVFLNRALNKMFAVGVAFVAIFGLIGCLVVLWITSPIEQLRKYAIDISDGRKGLLPSSNIKEIKHLSEAFEKMRISLEGKNAIEQYTQALTHELKSPLTVIKGAAELCLEEMDRVQQKKFLNNIIEESNRSHNLLKQLLKIASIETMHKLDQVSALDPVEILNETKDALVGLWRSKNILIEISGNVASKINGDKFLLFQAFRNVLQNAIEFSYNGSSIAISIKSFEKNIVIEVVDNGAGIPRFAMSRVFEKFYSLERPDTKRKSSGLGLCFVKEVVELHNGNIAVTSPVKENRGTLVYIELPT